MSFNQNLKQIRLNKGFTQLQLADKISISVRTYQNYEQGRREPDLNTLVKLAKALDVSTDKLLDCE